METRTISIGVDGSSMPVYEARPDAPNGAGIVVIQEAFGVNGHIEAVTRRFADLGYLAVAPHLFHRLDRTQAAYDDPSYVDLLEQLRDEQMLRDVEGALGVLARDGVVAARAAVVGFCMGGRVSFLVATHHQLGAAVGYYGGGIAVSRRANLPALADRAAGMKTPWLGIFGEADPHIPLDEVESIRAALAASPVPTEVLTYPDAGHGFNCDDRPAFHPGAASAAWSKTTQWLNLHLAGS